MRGERPLTAGFVGDGDDTAGAPVCEDAGTVAVGLADVLAGAFVADGLVTGPVPALPVAGADWPSWAFVLTSPFGPERLAFSRRVRAGEDLATGSWRLASAWRLLSLLWVALGLELSAGVPAAGVGVVELLAAGAPVPVEAAGVSAWELR